MKIIDNRKNKTLKPQNMINGVIYHVTVDDRTGGTEKHIVMKGCPSDLDIIIEKDEILLVELNTGTIFTVEYNEFKQIELLDTKLIIE